MATVATISSIGGAGNDLLYGDDGNDYIDDSSGANVVRGGGGNDYLSSRGAGSKAFGGSGDDTIFCSADTSASGGVGDDTFYLSLGNIKATGGNGKDTFQFHLSNTNIKITDFLTGNKGDVAQIDALFAGFTNYNNVNPFADGHLLLKQHGSDTWFEVDLDGSGTEDSATLVAVFKDTHAKSFTAFNLNGVDPGGTPIAGISIEGGHSDDELTGTVGNDTIHGADGNDLIDGGAGNDQLYGDAGNDYIDDSSGANIVSGGSGNDYLSSRGSGSKAFGGTGNDTIFCSANTSASGGTGDDILYLSLGNIKATGGDGIDTFQFHLSNTNVKVTDFETGNQGDVAQIDALFAEFTNYNNLNPFADGHLLLTQHGGDSWLEADLDGAGDEVPAFLIAIFKDTHAKSFTAYNFNGVDPDGAPIAGKSIDGSLSDDELTGTVGNDEIHGNGGNDLIDGGAGNDLLYGDDGNDYIDDSSGANVVRGGGGNDYLSSRGAGSKAVGGSGDDTIFCSADTSASGGVGDDTFYLSLGNIKATGGDGKDTFQFHLSNTNIKITDFQTGKHGDVAQIDAFFANFTNYNNINPFADGHLLLEQHGGDTWFKVDFDGSGEEEPATLVAIFKDTHAKSFTAFNFNGVDPDGTPIGQTANDVWVH